MIRRYDDLLFLLCYYCWCFQEERLGKLARVSLKGARTVVINVSERPSTIKSIKAALQVYCSIRWLSINTILELSSHFVCECATGRSRTVCGHTTYDTVNYNRGVRYNRLICSERREKMAEEASGTLLNDYKKKVNEVRSSLSHIPMGSQQKDKWGTKRWVLKTWDDIPVSLSISCPLFPTCMPHLARIDEGSSVTVSISLSYLIFRFSSLYGTTDWNDFPFKLSFPLQLETVQSRSQKWKCRVQRDSFLHFRYTFEYKRRHHHRQNVQMKRREREIIYSLWRDRWKRKGYKQLKKLRRNY